MKLYTDNVLPFINDDALTIGAHADHRLDYVFPRTQSPKMRDAKWEEREPSLERKPVRNLILNLIERIAA